MNEMIAAGVDGAVRRGSRPSSYVVVVDFFKDRGCSVHYHGYDIDAIVPKHWSGNTLQLSSQDDACDQLSFTT